MNDDARQTDSLTTDEAAEVADSSSNGCGHCDSGEDHQHIDEKGLVDAYRVQLRGSGIARALLAAILLVGGVLLSAFGVLGGVLAWAIVTAVGIAVVAVSRTRTTMANSVLFGAIASATLTPVLAWVLATWVAPGGGLKVAIAAAGGWFGVVALAELKRDRNLGVTLIADSRDGEAARQGVLFGEPVSPWAGLGWSVFTAALFGLWTWAIGAVAFLVFPLIPLHVVLSLVSRRGKK